MKKYVEITIVSLRLSVKISNSIPNLYKSKLTQICKSMLINVANLVGKSIYEIKLNYGTTKELYSSLLQIEHSSSRALLLEVMITLV